MLLARGRRARDQTRRRARLTRRCAALRRLSRRALPPGRRARPLPVRGDVPVVGEERERVRRHALRTGHRDGVDRTEARGPIRREKDMRKNVLVVLVCCGAFLTVPLVSIQGAAAGNGTLTCTDAFAGTAVNVIVPHDNGCDLSGATVTQDVIVEHNAGLSAEGLTVGHDIKLAQEDFADRGGPTI